jgi:hypothetical protein
MAKPEVLHAGPSLKVGNGKKSDVWIIGKNLDDLKKKGNGDIHDDAIVVTVKGHIWKHFKSGTPINSTGGNKKLWVRLKYDDGPGVTKGMKPKIADDDFAAMTITITNDDNVSSGPPQPTDPPPGFVVFDGPEPLP